MAEQVSQKVLYVDFKSEDDDESLTNHGTNHSLCADLTKDQNGE